MFTVNTQNFYGEWTSETFETKQDVFAYVGSLDVMQAVEIEGVEQADSIISFDELEAWLKA